MSPRSAAEQDHRELGHSAEIQRILDGFSARWLCTCSRAFCGDLAMMQVLSAVALASLAGEEGSASLSASQIARRTRVPRQTVTRKLLAMADKGWVVRCPDGRWTLDRSTTPPKVSRDLGALWESVTSLIAGLVADVTTSIEGRTAGHG
ncbi:helix-turn-helix domain-containing protein [Nostoc sp. NIES-2111]